METRSRTYHGNLRGKTQPRRIAKKSGPNITLLRAYDGLHNPLGRPAILCLGVGGIVGPYHELTYQRGKEIPGNLPVFLLR